MNQPPFAGQHQGSIDPNPQGYRPPAPIPNPMAGARPPPPGQNMYNGPSGGQRMPAQPGQFSGSPSKPGPPSQFVPPTQNGPQPNQMAGPHGDSQYGAPRGGTSGFPARPSGPGQFQGPPTGAAGPQFRAPPPAGQPPLPTNQMTSQMETMNLGSAQNQPGPSNFPPTSAGSQQTNFQPGPPSNVPPASGIPPRPQVGPPMGMGPPQTQTGEPRMPPPPAQMGPPTGIGSQPGMAPPPTSMGPSGMAPTSMGHTGMAPPPTSMGPPSSNVGMHQGVQGLMAPGPTTSQYSGFPGSPSPMSSAGIPSQPGFPPAGQFSQAGGQFPPPGPGSQMPPPGSGSQMPPPGPGGQFPPPGPGGQFPPPSPSGQYPPQADGQIMTGGPQAPNQMQPGFTASGQQMGNRPGMQPQAARKLDPDQMPSPIQVIDDDCRNRSGIFQTGNRGAVPPLVTTPFTTQDQGNSNPRFIRSTMYNIPCTSDMLKNCHIPFALTVTPFARLHPSEQEPPLVDLGELGPIRCKRCKAYMNPNMKFIDSGRRFQCVFCSCATDVPAEYFAHLDHTGKRVDTYDRAELCLGSYEIVATKDYCKNGVLPKPPAYIFMIDVSYNSVKSGLVNLICSRLKQDILSNLPKEAGATDSEIRVGFVTYAKDLHFYNVKGSLAQPQMMVVSDLEDVFVPLLDGFLVKLSESDAVIDSLLSQIPQMFNESRETEIVLGPVIQAGLDACKAADCSGKLFIFHTSLPIAEAPGKLKNRDDRKLLGTDKEKTILSPQNNFYTKLGQDCVTAGCSVDLFLFPNSYLDVASIGEVCRLTGGNIYKYSYFQADLDGDRFIEDLKRDVERPAAFDAILRVRTSTGIRPVDFYGNFYMSNTTDVELAVMDSNQAINIEIKHDDKLSEADGAFIQVAVLFTSVGGQRRLRVHNLALNCCTQMADLFRSCELDTLVNYMAKLAIRSTLNNNPKVIREHLMNQVSNILACYRKNCASPSSAGQLILPECTKLLPLYANCVIKSDAVQGASEISTDDRSYLMHMVNAMDVRSSSCFFYPRLIPLHDIVLDSNELPAAIRCSVERLEDNGAYLLDNGLSMFMWLGHNLDSDWIQKVFGVQSAAQIDIDKCKLFELDNPVSIRIRNIINKIRSLRSRHMKLTIVRQRDKLEPWFHHFLVEDKGLNGTASYVDFLCHIHREIRNLLS